MLLARLHPAAGIRAIIAPAHAKTSKNGALSRRRCSESSSIAEHACVHLFSEAAQVDSSGIAGAAVAHALCLPALACPLHHELRGSPRNRQAAAKRRAGPTMRHL